MPLIRLNRHPTPRQLAVFAAAWAVLGGILAWLQWRVAHPVAAGTAGILAVAAPILWFTWRQGLRGLFLGLSYVTYPIGVAISAGVLVVLYLGVLTPIGFVLRVCGHDAMQRTKGARADSYWHRRDANRPAARYLRQY
ncbi:MAG TPA: hypothetical protein VF388_02300 [Lacunisphaera sp.]